MADAERGKNRRKRYLSRRSAINPAANKETKRKQKIKKNIHKGLGQPFHRDDSNDHTCYPTADGPKSMQPQESTAIEVPNCTGHSAMKRNFARASRQQHQPVADRRRLPGASEERTKGGPSPVGDKRDAPRAGVHPIKTPRTENNRQAQSAPANPGHRPADSHSPRPTKKAH